MKAKIDGDDDEDDLVGSDFNLPPKKSLSRVHILLNSFPEINQSLLIFRVKLDLVYFFPFPPIPIMRL